MSSKLEKLNKLKNIRNAFFISALGIFSSCSMKFNVDSKNSGIINNYCSIDDATMRFGYQGLLDFTRNKIDYVIDTVRIDSSNLFADRQWGRYVPLEDKIHISYFDVDTAGINPNSWFLEKIIEFNEDKNLVKSSTMIHEEDHRGKQKLGVRKITHHGEFLDFRLETYGKINQYFEASANLRELMLQREVYKQTGDIAVIDNYKFKEYVNDLKEGKVKPFSKDIKENEKEYASMINSVVKGWNYRYIVSNIYQKQAQDDMQMAIDVAEKKDLDFPKKDNPLEFNMKMNKMFSMNIDGKVVNFWTYREFGLDVLPARQDDEFVANYYKSRMDNVFERLLAMGRGNDR